MVATWDGSNASMYINGSLVSGPTARSWNTVSNASYVGAQTGGAEYWVGNIAQVLVYDRDLTAGEILQNFNVDKSRFGL
jgi:flagella basal body P-ring formation protein FlgA